MLHRSLLRAAALAALVFASSAFAQTFTVHQNLAFAVVPTGAGPKTLLLDLYLPNSGPGPFPVVMWIHGGGWIGGSKAGAPAAELAPFGYAVASIEYRLSGEAIWPAQMHDVKGAVRWLRANSAAWNLDPTRMGAWGSSAGGHLAAFLGTSGDVGVERLGSTTIDLEGVTGGNLGESSRVQAVVDWFGPTDFLSMPAFPANIDHDAATSPESKLLGQAIDDVPMLVASADPRTWLTADDPPVLIQHGTADPTVPFFQSSMFFDTARFRAGMETSFVPVIDGGHGGPGFVGAVARAYFDEHLKNTPAVSVSIATVGADPGEGAGPSGAFRLSRTGSTTSALVARIVSAGGAREGVDYAPLGALAVVPAGATFVDIAPVPINDFLVEGAEAIELRVRASPNYRVAPSASPARLFIVDDEPTVGPPTVTVATIDATATETPANPGAFAIARTGSTASALTVRVHMAGRAKNAVDYAFVPNVVTLPPGAASVQVVIAPFDDPAYEPTESVVLELDPGPNYVVGVARAADLRIVDNDTGTQPLIGIVAEAFDVAETSAAVPAFSVTRTGSTLLALDVALAPSGSVQPGTDVVPLPTTVHFNAGSAFAHVQLDPLDDALVEGDEEARLAVVPGGAYRPGLAPAAGVRVVDDEAPVPQTSFASLGASAFVFDEPFVTTVSTPIAFAPCAWFFSVAPAYVSTGAGNMPLLVDLTASTLIGPIAANAGGVATIAGVLPQNVPGIEGIVLRIQAATLDAQGVVVLTPRVERRVVRD